MSGILIPAILEHAWGVSPGADRVWSQVVGLRPGEAGKRLLMVYQAYVDDSRKGDTLVLGGYLSTAERWARFSSEWEQLVEAFGTLGADGRKHFKMSEMNQNAERLERVPIFAKIAEQYALLALSGSIDCAALRRAQNRISIPGYNFKWGVLENPFVILFASFMKSFHNYKEDIADILPVDSPVDFIFDEQREKRIIRDGWNQFKNANPSEFISRFGSEPRFENDKDFLPIQAADLWAWHVRSFIEGGSVSLNGFNPEAQWSGNRTLPRIHLEVDEDEAADRLKGMLRSNYGQEVVILDVSFEGECLRSRH